MSTQISNDVFCLALTKQQLDFLCEPKYCERRMKLYATLLYMASEKDSQSTKRGINIPVSIGKVEISEVILAARLGWNRKTVSDYIKSFNKISLIKTTKDNKSSVHSILTLSGWLNRNGMIRNPLYHRPTEKGSLESTDKIESSIPVITEPTLVASIQTDTPDLDAELSASEQTPSVSYKSVDGMDPEPTTSFFKEHSSDSGAVN